MFFDEITHNGRRLMTLGSETKIVIFLVSASSAPVEVTACYGVFYSTIGFDKSIRFLSISIE